MFILVQVIILSLFVQSNDAHAWGKRGHQIIGEVAAMVVSEEYPANKGIPSSAFMKDHGFDFGYYNNVPDLVWKKPATYEAENTNHFMDMEIFERELQKVSAVTQESFKLTRKEFDKKFPEITQKAGRSFWRINEIVKTLEKTTVELKKTTAKLKKVDPKKSEKLIAEHRKLQEKWLLHAGVVGHYMADLAQPLHVTENYDGQLSEQSGIHNVYETTYVDELYPAILNDVYNKAKKEWPQFKKQNSSKSLLDLMMFVAETSARDLKVLLAKDKKLGRQNLKKNAEKFKKDLESNLVLGSLALAEIYRRHLGWQYFGEKFYFFDSSPQFIKPESF